MNRILLFSLLLMFSNMEISAQEWQRPAEGKSLVYFVRYAGTTALLDFKYFDGESYLGRIGGTNYFTYECEPGEHVFWVAGESNEYIAGNLQPNAVYIIEVKPYLRVVMVSPELIQISPDDTRTIKKIQKVVGSMEASDLKGQEEDQSELIDAGMKTYKDSRKKIKHLNSDWIF